jgi:purine-binding chemotaxis protein CheW
VEGNYEIRGTTGEIDQMINFVVGGEEYGVDIQRVKEVIRIKEITRLPSVPSFVKGVINLRGDVIPIIDLREKFDLKQKDYQETTRVIVVEVEGRSIGMVVDSVSHVVRITSSQVGPPPLVGGSTAECINGVVNLGERLILLLNIDKMLTTEERLEIKNALNNEALVRQ